MNWWLLYLAGGPVTGILLAVADFRRGAGLGWWWLLVCCSVPGLLWPLLIGDAVCDLIDGPHEPRHRAHWC